MASTSKSSCSCTHRLELTNLVDGEAVNHSILLIKGRVCQEKSIIDAQVGRCASQEVQLRYLGRVPSQSVAENQWQHVNTRIGHSGQFKLLLNLHQYSVSITLELQLSYCNVQQQLRISYKPNTAHHRLQPLYIVCDSDEAPPVSAPEICDLIDLNLSLVQCIYAEQLRVAGFGRRTFNLNGNCEVFHSRLTRSVAWQCSEDELWQYFAQELLNCPRWSDSPELKFVAFIDCTAYDGAAVVASGDYSYANIRRHLRAHAALGGGGLALFGSAYFYAWPQKFHEIIECLCSERTVDRTQLPEDSNYRGTYGGVYASTLGAIVHEIGHIFELGHTNEGIMGGGFDYANRVFTVDKRTESLPNRIIQRKVLEVHSQSTVTRPRLTQLKKIGNSFLQKYHEQRENDSFFFTRNCLIILAHHKWLNDSKPVDEVVNVEFEPDSKTVISSEPLKLIEVRSSADGLVKYWYEFQSHTDGTNVLCFRLPMEGILLLEQQHYVFVLTKSGYTKRLCESGQ